MHCIHHSLLIVENQALYVMKHVCFVFFVYFSFFYDVILVELSLVFFQQIWC